MSGFGFHCGMVPYTPPPPVCRENVVFITKAWSRGIGRARAPALRSAPALRAAPRVLRGVRVEKFLKRLMSAVIKNGDPSERGPPRVCRFTARYRFCNEIRYGYKPISDKIFGCTHRKHAVTAAAKAPLEHISGGKPLEGSVVARRAPETVDQAREHREIREFLDGTVTGTAAAPMITGSQLPEPMITGSQLPEP